MDKFDGVKISDLTVGEFRHLMTEILESHQARSYDLSAGRQPRPHIWEMQGQYSQQFANLPSKVSGG